MKPSKTRTALKALQRGDRLSGHDFLHRFGIYRASSVIHKLRNRGYQIKTEIEEFDGENYAVYSISQ